MTKKPQTPVLPAQESPAALAQPLLSHIELQSLHLMGVNSLRLPKLDEHGKLDLPFVPTETMEIAFDPDSRRVMALVTVNLACGEGENQLLRVEALYRVVYRVKDSYSGDDLSKRAEAFCRAHSLAHVWPYWRELLASLCVKMELPPILAPLLIIGTPGAQRPNA